MLTRERHALLLQWLAKEGRLVAKNIATTLNVSEDTIRRDLRSLAAAGKLQRVHGGALPASPAVGDFETRRRLAADEKDALAQRAVSLIEPGQLVFLDGGTTSLALVRALPPNVAITVVTHSPNVAAALAERTAIPVDLIGGRLFRHSIVTVGAVAARAISRVRPDLFVMGVTGIHPEAGATTGDGEEAAIKALIASQSAETMVLASADKLGAASPHLIAPLSEITTLVVPRGTPDAQCRALSAEGPDVIAGAEVRKTRAD